MTSEGEIGLSDVLDVIRARIWLVVSVFVLTLVIGSVFLIRWGYPYRSEAFLELHREVSIYNAQRYAFYDKKQLSQYLKSQPEADPQKQRLLSQLSESLIRKNVKPLSTDGQKGGGGGTALAGLELHAQSNASPEDAVGSLKLLAGYIVDAQLKQSLRGALRDSYLASKLRDREIETLVINKSLHLHDLEQTLKDMKEIAGRAPPLPVWKGEGLISNVGDAGRYLPPRVQVTGIESMMSTLRAEIRELAMERGRVDIRLGFYRKLYEVMPESSTGTQMLEFFRAFVRDYFAKSGDSEDVRVIRNEFIAVADNLVAQRLDRPYFTAGPSVPGSRTGSLPIFGAVFMLVILGVGFSVGLALMVSAVSTGWKKGAAPVTLPDQMPVADYCNRGG